MTPNRVIDLREKDIASFEQLQDAYQLLLEQVRFGPPVWDKEKKRFLRLSAKRIFEDRQPEDSLLPKIDEVKVYLSVFDVDFNLISEFLVSELSDEFTKYFAKDGKLWVYQNFNDELGFVIIDI